MTIGTAGRTLVLCWAALGAPALARAQDKVWDNYDFVPGGKVLFYTDFSEDKVGNFARGLKYTSGSLDVVELNGVKVLRSLSRAEFAVVLGRPLPARFTLEIDLISPRAATAGYDQIAFEGGGEWDRGDTSAEINWTESGMVLIGGGQDAGRSQINFPDAFVPGVRGTTVHLRMLMDGDYFKFYTNERRVYNIPQLPFKRNGVIRFLLNGSEEPNSAAYIASIRIAESQVDVLYDALAAKGRWATQGILFETGKADLRPESRPVLKEIAGALKDHPDLKVLIEGHTDNVGAPAANLTLSAARADAVKAALVTGFGSDAARITTKGLGDTKPAVPNTSAAGRAQNRRVEVVKQ